MHVRTLKLISCLAVSVLLFAACATRPLKELAHPKSCGDYMCLITIAAKGWAIDHNGCLPADVSYLTNELVLPSILVCPHDRSRRPAPDWQSFKPDQVSYEVLNPHLHAGDTNRAFLRCRIHQDHVAYADGTVLEGNGRQRWVP